MNNRSQRVIIIIVILAPLLYLVVTKVLLHRRKIELRDKADQLSKNISDLEQKINSKDNSEALTWQEYHKRVSKPITWNFLEDQPNWLLKPGPEHNEKTANGLNIRINSSSSTALQNNKDSWSADNFKSIHIQVGPVFEKLDIEITLRNEAGETFIINGKEQLKEGINSISLVADKNPTGEINDTEIRFYSKQSRNISAFTLSAVQLTP